MSGFPSLKPAFTVRVVIDSPMAVGAQAGAPLVVVVSGFWLFCESAQWGEEEWVDCLQFVGRRRLG